MQIANTLNLRPFLNLNLDNKTEKKSIWSEPVAQNTFAQLRPQSMSSARKAAAKQKIAELKTRLDAMNYLRQYVPMAEAVALWQYRACRK